MKKIDIKSWDEYTQTEKRELLNHWWFYYGKKLVTFEESEKFLDLVELYPDKIFDFAVMNYINSKSNELILMYIRENKQKKLIEIIEQVYEVTENNFEQESKIIKEEFIKEIVGTYNNPKPPIPLDEKDYIRQLKNILKNKS